MSEQEPLYLAELAAYQLGVGTATLRYASGRGHVTTPSETPANTEYDARIRQPVNVARHCFAPRSTIGRSVFGYGDLVLKNGDGVLDTILTAYAVDGRVLTIRRGLPGAAYPGGFTPVFAGTMEQAEAKDDSVIVRVKDRSFALDVPLQTTLYDGDNVLPDGLEGTADDLKGKPKPLVFGAVKNVAPPQVNTSKLIYQVNDGTIASVDGVYDAGITLGAQVTFEDADPSAQVANEEVCRGAIVFGDGVVCIGTVNAAVNDGDIYYSATGYGAWSVGAQTLSSYISSLCTDGTTLLATSLGANCVATSTDGAANWTNRSIGGSASVLCSFYSARLALWFIGTAGGAIYTASDPTSTWTLRTSGFGATSIRAFAESDTTVVAVGDSGKISSSTNGTTWTARTSSITGNYAYSLYAVAFGERSFRAAGLTGILLYSADGEVWERESHTFDGLQNGTAPDFYSVRFLDDIWYAFTPSSFLISYGESRTYTRLQSNIAHVISSGVNDDGVIIGGTYDGAGNFSVCRGLRAVELADLTELEDDTLAPQPGDYTWVSNAAGSYIRLGSTPYGQITADVTQGAAAADRTAGSLFENVLTKAGYTSADWVTGDVTTLDAADDSVLGLWSYEDGLTVAGALDLIANTVGAWWGPRASDGDFRIVQLLLPTGTPAATLFPNDMVEGSFRLIPSNDEGRGLPAWRTTLRYQRNWTPQTDDLAFGVSDARRAFLAAEWRETSDSDSAVKTSYLLARDIVEETLYDVEADALAEAQRRQVIRETRRRMFELTVEETDATASLDLGQVVTIQSSRYGLSAGVDFRIIGVEPDAKARRVTLIVWG